MWFVFRNHCMGCVPAHLGAGLSRRRKVELPHSQGIGQAWGWVGTCSCDGPYSCTIHYFAIKYAQRYQEALLNWTDAWLRVGQLWRLLFLGEESGASALSGDWLGGGAGRCVHVCRSILQPHPRRFMEFMWQCKFWTGTWQDANLPLCGPFLREESGASALLRVGSVWGLAGAHTCTGQLSSNSVGHTISTMPITCLIISRNIISFGMSYNNLAPPPHTHPCCVPPTDWRSPPHKWGKSAPKQLQWILTLRKLT